MRFKLPLHVSLFSFAIIGLCPKVASSQRIAFVALLDDGWIVHSIDDDANSPIRIQADATSDGSAPAISPSGRYVAYELQGVGVVVHEIAKGSHRSINNQVGMRIARPAWTHGAVEALTCTHFDMGNRNEDSELFVWDKELAQSRSLILHTGVQDHADHSPDAQFIAYSSAQKIGLRNQFVRVTEQLWLMNLVTGQASPLSFGAYQDLHPDWSPDSSEIAFSSNRTGQFEIWALGRDGKNVRQLSTGDGAKTWPSWSPDGKSLMFTLARGGEYSLWIIDADGANLRQFRPFGSESEIQTRDADWK